MMGPVLLPTGLRNSKRRLSKKYELRHRNMVADDQPCDLASQSKVWHACFKLLQVAQAFLFKRFLLSQCVLSAAWVIMPLSSDQVTALKNPETKNAFQHQNPKKGRSNAWGINEKYKKCVSIGEATAAGANWQDLSSDFKKDYMKFPPWRMSRCQLPQKEQQV